MMRPLLKDIDLRQSAASGFSNVQIDATDAIAKAWQTHYKVRARAAWCCPVLKGSAMSLSALLSDERQIIDAILDAASLSDFLVSVYDGEEWALTVSDSRPAIAAVVGATDCTTLRFRRRRLGADGRPSSVGSVFLVHGNGCDVIADYSDNAETARLLEPARALADRLAVVS